MRLRKQVRICRDGLDLAADVNVAIVVNHGEPGEARKVETVRQLRIVQSSRHRRLIAGQHRTTGHGEQEVSNGRAREQGLES
jgi:hypothetical protein